MLPDRVSNPGHLTYESGALPIATMAQMAHFSFPYYFTIPNSEICSTNFGIRNCEVYIIWASDNN